MDSCTEVCVVLALDIHADAAILAGRLETGDVVNHSLEEGRHAWVQVARGAVTLNGQPLAEGDGAGVSEETALEITATQDAEVLVFDLA